MPRKYAAYGKLLKYYRELVNLKIHPPWTQARIAKALGVSQRTYAGWENGESQPSSDDLRNFVAVLELSEEDEKTLYRSIAQVPPEIDNLPFQRNPFFTGREEHLDRLRTELQEAGTAAITQSISGLGGIGKTQLALEYAHCHYPKVYRVALWVNADKETLPASYASLAETLGLEKRHEPELDRRIEAVKQWLAEHTNWLLIMDNADDLSLARSFLPGKPLGHVVFTTRSRIIGTIAKPAKRIELEEMTQEEGLLFLLQRACVIENETMLDAVATNIQEYALELVELLGGHPLALDQAGAYIEGTGVAFDDYLRRYGEQRRCLLSKRRIQESELGEHPASVVTTLVLSIQQSGKQHPLATDILNFCVFLQPDAIPEELFLYDDSFNSDILEFDQGIAALQRYSLIKYNKRDQTFSIHRLVQAVLIDAIPPDVKEQYWKRVYQAVEAAISIAEDQRVELKRHVLLYGQLLPQVLDDFESFVQLSREEKIDLLLLASYYYYTRGQLSEADQLLTRALLYCELFHRREDLHTSESLFMSAYLSFLLDKVEQSEKLLVRHIPILEKHLGTENILMVSDTVYTIDALALSLLMLAAIYFELGKNEQADILIGRALTEYEKHSKAKPSSTVVTLLAILHDQGKHEQAEALYLRVLSIIEQRSGTTHPVIQAIKTHYANFLIKHGITPIPQHGK